MSVVVVGSANVDTVLRVPRIPSPGETVLATGRSRGPGGKGANQAVAAARLGAPTAFVGVVGQDEDGALLRASLTAAGVDVSALQTCEEPTGSATITVAPGGENAIVVASGANAALTGLDPAQRDAVAAADVVLAQLEIPLATVAAATAARGPGALMVLNAAPAAALPDELLAAVDVLVVNEHELAAIAGIGPVSDASRTLAQRVPALVVTLGERGALVLDASAGEGALEIAASPAQPVDTTGAGDTFCGVLAARLAIGARLPDAARWASAAAAVSVEHRGAQTSMPGPEQVRARMER